MTLQELILLSGVGNSTCGKGTKAMKGEKSRFPLDKLNIKCMREKSLLFKIYLVLTF